jgi:hypothetical protein
LLDVANTVTDPSSATATSGDPSNGMSEPTAITAGAA